MMIDERLAGDKAAYSTIPSSALHKIHNIFAILPHTYMFLELYLCLRS